MGYLLECLKTRETYELDVNQEGSRYGNALSLNRDSRCRDRMLVGCTCCTTTCKISAYHH